MQPEVAAPLLTKLRDEIDTLPHTNSAEFASWNQRTRSVLVRAMGETHAITQSFITIRWNPTGLLTDRSFDYAFRAGQEKARGLLDAAMYELVSLGVTSHAMTEEGIDLELWEHVRNVFETDEWGKVARESLIFTEDWIRSRAGRPHSEFGEKLMVAVFGDDGDYRLGMTDPERQGWQLLAMGVSKALRNADTHRIQKRADLKLYAVGVMGMCSLLLTQIRYEHANRLHDAAPVERVAETD
jgi:Protein of unknown function (Hypoth_ymh)